MSAVTLERQQQQQEEVQFELTDLRIPFVDMAGRVYKPETVIVAFKTKEIMRAFYQSVKHRYSNLVVFDRRDDEPNSMGIRLSMEHTQDKTVNDILKLLRGDLGADKVNQFIKKYYI
ncbi:MAG: hypothetical protein K1X28_02730 [Parachlamydiales bacterium]|nr:hypothetical protein [Parachlamydiales bacterium]